MMTGFSLEDTVTISPFEVENWREARDYYTRGGCADLAMAIQQQTGWRMGLLFKRGESVAEHGMGHAYAIREDGMLVDINGVQSQAEMATKWAPQITWGGVDPHMVEFVALTKDEATEIYEAYRLDHADGGNTEAMDQWWARRLLAEIKIHSC